MKHPQVVTGNALMEGDAVWRAASGAWVRTMAEAELLTTPEAAEAALAAAKAQPDVIVGPYLADAKAGPIGPEPVHFREAFRTRGPSNYRMGKQAGAMPGPLEPSEAL